MIAMSLLAPVLANGVLDHDGPIRWGVMGAGLISRDFVGALKALSPEEGVVVAVGARNLEGAAALARELCVERVHEGYEALAADPEVGIIYVGTVAQAHVRCAQIALAAGKHVVVEKPLALCASDAKALTQEARARGLFLQEGMWTRCFPAVRKARALLAAGAIGEVVAVSADFGWAADPAVHARTLDPRSGGVCLDVAMYCVAHVLLAAGAGMPRRGWHLPRPSPSPVSGPASSAPYPSSASPNSQGGGDGHVQTGGGRRRRRLVGRRGVVMAVRPGGDGAVHAGRRDARGGRVHRHQGHAAYPAAGTRALAAAPLRRGRAAGARVSSE